MGIFIEKNLDYEIIQAQIQNTGFLSQCKLYCRRSFEMAWQKVVDGQRVVKTLEEAQAWFDKIGNQSALAFAAHGKLQELIYMNDPTWVPLSPPYAYTINKDGTVTLSERE